MTCGAWFETMEHMEAAPAPTATTAPTTEVWTVEQVPNPAPVEAHRPLWALRSPEGRINRYLGHTDRVPFEDAIAEARERMAGWFVPRRAVTVDAGWDGATLTCVVGDGAY